MTITLTSIDGKITREFINQTQADEYLVDVHSPIINWWITSSIIGETPSMFKLIEDCGEENFYDLQLNTNASWEVCKKVLSITGLPILFTQN